MTIKEVKVIGLFGRFSHTIKFKKGGISLIIGENGVGKTISLTMIESLFNKNYKYFVEIDFKSMVVIFEGDTWTVSKTKMETESEKIMAPAIKIENNKGEVFQVPLANHERASRRFRILEDGTLYDRFERIFYTPDAFLDKFGFMPLDAYQNDTPKWFETRLQENKIKLIAAQRLYHIRPNDSVIVAIRRDSEELARNIQKEISNASEISAALDSSFPNRLMSEMKKRKVHPFNELLKALADLENMRKRLNDVGLIGSDNKQLEWDIQTEEMKKVLWLYIEDSKEKLNAYKVIVEKLTLMRDIINRRFKFKQLYIDKEKGYVFKDSSNPNLTIPVDKLSSGEQNEMVLIYHLLFNCNENDIIMIDEPEISLHITWQHHMIEDFGEISKLNHLSLLLATHSPDLIGDNWNLVQTLS